MSDDFLVDEGIEDEESEEQDYKSFNDGAYKIKGFDWIKVDEETENPIVQSQDGLPKIFIKFVLENGDEGPPYSLSLGEMNLLLLAKDKGLDYLPVPEMSEAGKVLDYLEEIKVKFNSLPETLEVVVKKGWVNRIKGMQESNGTLYFYLVNVSPTNEDGVPYPKDGDYGKYFFTDWIVVAGEGRQPSKFDNCVFTELINYAVKVVDGKAQLETKKDGQPTASAKRLSKMFRLTAPEKFANFRPSDPNNLLSYWAPAALENKIVLTGVRSKDGVRYKLNFPSLSPAEGFENQSNLEGGNEDEDSKARSILCDTISYLADGDPVPLTGSTYSDKVTAIMKKHLSPLKAEGKIHRQLKILTFDDCVLVMESIINDEKLKDDNFVSTCYGKLTKLGIGVDQDDFPSDFPEVDESPF